MKKKKIEVAGVAELRSILEEQEFKCAITKEDLSPENTAFDHIIPVSKGGNSLKGNLHAVTKEINRCKGVLGMKEFVDICAIVIENRGKEYGYELSKTKV